MAYHIMNCWASDQDCPACIDAENGCVVPATEPCAPCDGPCKHTVPNCAHPHTCGNCAVCEFELCA